MILWLVVMIWLFWSWYNLVTTFCIPVVGHTHIEFQYFMRNVHCPSWIVFAQNIQPGFDDVAC